MTLPTKARAVIIGGGISGLSVLYHLANAGWTDLVLIEKNQLTSGTTWHSAALVTPMRGSKSLTTLGKYSGNLYESLVEETGVETGMRRCGHLNVASNPVRLQELHNTLSLAETFAIEAELISPDEIAGRWPIYRTDDLLGAVWTPQGGRADPSNICQALAKGAKSLGAKIREGVAVLGISTARGKVEKVHTSDGDIETEIVVNCAGLWGRQVAHLANVRAPLYACEHYYLLTMPLAQATPDLPILRDAEAGIYVREEVGGLLVGAFEDNAKALPLDRLPKDTAFALLNEDWDHFGPVLEGAIGRIPALESAEARMLLNGPESFTPDGSPLLGEAPNLSGFWFCCGMNSGGIALGGGVGWAMANWLESGDPGVDLSASDIKRFPDAMDSEGFLYDRVPETLGHHFAVRFPGREYRTGRDAKRSVFHQKLLEKGAKFGFRSGWERPLVFDPEDKIPMDQLSFARPVWFEQQSVEHSAARTEAALFDQSSFGKLLVTGRDAETVLQRLCANDVGQVGRAAYTAMTNPSGGFESDLTVARLSDSEFLLITGTAQTKRDHSWVAGHIGSDEFAVVVDVTSGWSTLLLTGPGARDILARITSEPLDSAAFPFGACKEIEVGYARVLALRLSYAGELGWELHIPTEEALHVYERLLAAAPDLQHAGTNALGSLRVEKGFRSWGHDIGPRDTPLEAGLSFAVAWKKPGGFLGLDALRRQAESPLKRRLLSFLVPDERCVSAAHSPIYRNGKVCGEITSYAWGYSVDGGVALGWLEEGSMADEDVLSDRFEVRFGAERFAAKPSLRGIYDPSGARMRA